MIDTRKEWEKRLDEILIKLVNTYKAGSNVHHPDYFEVGDAKEAISTAVLELIVGEDESFKNPQGWSVAQRTTDLGVAYKNYLRQEQRQTITRKP